MTQHSTLLFEIQSRPSFFVVGLEISGPYSKIPEIGAMWPTFSQRIPEIHNAVNAHIAYGITHDRATDFTYYAAIEVSDAPEVPEGLVKVEVPAGKYAVFTHKGTVRTLHQTIGAARQTLTEAGHELDTSSYWFELYDERFDPTSDTSELDLFFRIV